jgi:hypothetical protein
MDFSGATLTATGDSVKSNFCFPVQILVFNATIAFTKAKNQLPTGASVVVMESI